MKVLIAEDDGVCRALVESLLISWGFDVVSASDGTEAWSILTSASPPPIAILDWMMPGMNGPDICRNLRKEPTTAPIYVILLTGLEGKEMLVRGLESGANDYIVKPFERQELQARLNVGQRVVELQAASAARVEELKRQQQELTRLNRALKVLGEVGRTIATAATEPDLLREVCTIISSSGGYRQAWVGYTAPGSDTVVPLDYNPWLDKDNGNDGSAGHVNDSCSTSPYGAGHPVPAQYASSLSLPLISDRQVVGVLTIHSDEAGSFDARERILLEELADELAYGIATLRSKNESRLAEMRIAESERFAQSTLDALPNQIAILDESGKIIAVNRTWRSSTDENGFVRCETCEGTDYLSFCTGEGISPDLNGEALACGIRKVLAKDLPHYSMEYFIRNSEADTTWYMTRVAPFHGEGARRVVVIHEDISELKRAEFEIERLAYSDPLTGLPNRTLFRDRLDQVLAQAVRKPCVVALMFIDLDHFKVINDTLGHSTGDMLLEGVATRISNRIRKTDTVARMGGDEFVVLMNGIRHPEDAAHAAQDFLDSLHQPFILGGQEVFITASIGIALCPMDGIDADTLLKNADIAMYYAKERGRNAHQFYTPIMNAKAEERLSIESSLRRAVERNELILHFQPWYDLKQEKISGMEALVRWNSPTQGLVQPEKFIPLAEETGLIIPIGEWVLREACRHIRMIQDKNIPGITVSVNVSGRQLKQLDLLDSIRKIIDETGIDPRRLELELTETSIMENAEETVKTLHAFKEMGIMLSIDDFGTGYSSLNYLKRFPIDKLKIDRSFVCEIPSDEGDMGIIRAIIAFAQSLKMKVIAEGVETIDQLAFLSAHRCNEIQGFFVSQPICQADIFTLLQKN